MNLSVTENVHVVQVEGFMRSPSRRTLGADGLSQRPRGPVEVVIAQLLTGAPPKLSQNKQLDHHSHTCKDLKLPLLTIK